jgi:predicted tellurium resistance membrane protein TerC
VGLDRVYGLDLRVDFISAIFAITSSSFAVWSPNAFVVLGLRLLYFMLAG